MASHREGAISDRGQFWRPHSDALAPIARSGWTAARVMPLRQTLISGDIAAALERIACDANAIGLWEIARGETYCVRISRDRALLVGPPGRDVRPGWRDGFVTTACDDAFAVFDLSGEAVADLVAEATSAGLRAGSRSASVIFAGVEAYLYRTGPTIARLHVDSSLAMYLYTWLDGVRS